MGVSRQEESSLVSSYTSCWEDRADMETDYCVGLEVGEEECRLSVLGHSHCLDTDRRDLLIIRTRGEQANILIQLGWQCPILAVWAAQDEMFTTILSRSRSRNAASIARRVL